MDNPIIRQTHSALLKSKSTIAVAESCTGGLISYLLTKLPGSSGYFVLGIVAYSNKTKIELLKVPAGIISKNGAVSAETALFLAEGVRRLANTDFGIGITGIAGPGGGTSAKPVGTVFIAVARKKIAVCKKFKFSGGRNSIRKKSALESLKLLSAARMAAEPRRK